MRSASRSQYWKTSIISFVALHITLLKRARRDGNLAHPSTFTGQILITFQAQCVLEQLPPELRIRIMLQLNNLASLRSLIFASPSYAATYLQVRQKVLSQVALRQVDDRIYADALAAVRSARLYENPPQGNELHLVCAERTTAFLDEYRHARLVGVHSDSLGEWLSCRSITEAIDLIRLLEAVQHVVAEYSLHVCSKMPQNKRPFHLSEMESLRIHRAMYRFQIYCNFFGRNPHMAPIHAGNNRRRAQHPIRRFLPSFPPWEVLEIACVWHYLRGRSLSLIREVSDENYLIIGGPEDHIGFAQEVASSGVRDPFEPMDVCGIPSQSTLCNDERIFSNQSNYQVAHFDENHPTYRKIITKQNCQYFGHQGPRFLAKILMKDMEGRRNAIKDIHPEHLFKPFDELDGYQIPLEGFISPADKYQSPDALSHLSTMQESERPSRGWKWFCHRYDIDSLGIGPGVRSLEIGQRIMRQSSGQELGWGFPFWDGETLEAWKVIMPSSFKKKKK